MKKILIPILIIALLVVGFFVLNSYIYNEKQGESIPQEYSETFTSDPLTIEFTVVDFYTGQPIPNTKITLIDPPMPALNTGDGGRGPMFSSDITDDMGKIVFSSDDDPINDYFQINYTVKNESYYEINESLGRGSSPANLDEEFLINEIRLIPKEGEFLNLEDILKKIKELPEFEDWKISFVNLATTRIDEDSRLFRNLNDLEIHNSSFFYDPPFWKVPSYIYGSLCEEAGFDLFSEECVFGAKVNIETEVVSEWGIEEMKEDLKSETIDEYGYPYIPNDLVSEYNLFGVDKFKNCLSTLDIGLSFRVHTYCYNQINP